MNLEKMSCGKNVVEETGEDWEPQIEEFPAETYRIVPDALRIINVLGKYSGTSKNKSRVEFKTIAHEAGISLEDTLQYLSSLKRLGFVSVEEVGKSPERTYAKLTRTGLSVYRCKE